MNRRCTDGFDVPSAFLLHVIKELSALTDYLTGVDGFYSDDTCVIIKMEISDFCFCRNLLPELLLDLIRILERGRIRTDLDPLLEACCKHLNDVCVLREFIEVLCVNDYDRTFELYR